MTGRTFATALLMTGALIATLWVCVNPIYLEIDDAAIRLTITGEDLAGEPPASHLVFTHEGLARFAVALQRTVPDLPIWDLVLSVTLVSGLGGLCAVAWSAQRTAGWARATGLAVTLAAAAPIVAGLQFTISAVIGVGAAVLLVICELFGKERPRPWLMIAAAVLLVSGYAIRPMAAEGAALIILACCLPVAVAREPWRRRLNRLIAFGLVLLAAFTVLDFADRALYAQRDGWADYYAHTWRFVNLIDWNSGVRNAHLDSIRAAANWSANDWQLLWAGWGPTDQTLFGTEPVAKAFEVLRTASSPLERARSAFQALDSRAIVELVRAMSGMMAPVLVLAIGLGNRRAVLVTLAVLLEFLVICVIVEAGFKELPFRLLAPLQVCLTGAIVVGISDHPRMARPWLVIMTMVITTALFAQQGWIAVQQARAEMNHARAIEDQTVEVLKLKPSLLVLHADAFPAGHWWRPFHRPPAQFPMIRLGGNNGSPLLQHYLKATGRTRLLVAICGDPSIMVIADRPRLDLVTRYMAEHEGRTITWEPAFEGSFSAWRCR